MEENRELFIKPEPKLSKSDQRISELERQIAELKAAFMPPPAAEATA